MSRNMLRALGVLLALGLVLPGSAFAQEPLDYPSSGIRGGTELGVDMAFSHNMIDGIDDNLTQLTLPFGGGQSAFLSPHAGLRAAFYLSPSLAIEPVTTFSYTKLGEGHETAWSFAAKVQYHFSERVTAVRPYLAAGGTFGLLDSNDSDSESQFGVTGEFGLKVPFEDYFGLRVAGGYTRLFENDNLPTQDILFLTVGFSVFFWK